MPTPPTRRRAPRHDLTDRSDDELLHLVRSGDSRAYGELWRRHHPALRRYVRTLVPDSAVDDVVSDTFVAVLEAIQRSHGPTDYPIRYLVVAARSVAIRHGRRRQRFDELLHQVGAPEHEPPVDEHLPDAALAEALAELPERWQHAIWMREVEQLTATEIGERLDIGPNAASALTYRARRAFRDAYLATSAA